MVRWLGLGWDGDAVHQSERLDLYGAAADRLRASDRAYWCECTPDDVKARKDARGEKTPGYDGFCRDRGLARSDRTAVRPTSTAAATPSVTNV